MSKKEKYLSIVKDGKNVFEILNELKEENNSIEAIAKLREIFPMLSLIEAKEILIINDNNFSSLNEYQENILDEILKKGNFD